MRLAYETAVESTTKDGARTTNITLNEQKMMRIENAPTTVLIILGREYISIILGVAFSGSSLVVF